MLDFFAAQAQIVNHGHIINSTETVQLDQLNHRILAQDIYARINVPPADNSAMDGYAINTASLGKEHLPLQEHVYAGATPEPLKDGHAMRIFTGGLVPAGANCVVIQENCSVIDKHLIILGNPRANDYIRYAGEDMAMGSVVLSQGTRLHSGHIAVLAAQGYDKVTVYKRLKIGILSTGDELYQPGQDLPAAAIYNSNSAMLASLCNNLGVNDVLLKHSLDDLTSITKAIDYLNNECDLVLTVGGVSVGDKDYIKPAIENLGGSLDLWRVKMKPGKPVALAQINNSLLIALPGNPVSSFVVFCLLASPLIRKMQGEQRVFRPVKRGLIKLEQSINNGERTDFIRVKALYTDNGLPQLQPFHLQSSGASSSLAWANGLAMIPAQSTIKNSTEINWYDFQDWLY